jgi:hypothetical protein
VFKRPELLEELKRLYSERWSLSSLAKKYKCSKVTVTSELKAAGVYTDSAPAGPERRASLAAQLARGRQAYRDRREARRELRSRKVEELTRSEMEALLRKLHRLQ